MLIWPPYEDSLAYDVITNKKFKYLIYIGEKEGGCVASDEFFNELQTNWKLIDESDVNSYFCFVPNKNISYKGWENLFFGKSNKLENKLRIFKKMENIKN